MQFSNTNTRLSTSSTDVVVATVDTVIKSTLIENSGFTSSSQYFPSDLQTSRDIGYLGVQYLDVRNTSLYKFWEQMYFDENFSVMILPDASDANSSVTYNASIDPYGNSTTYRLQVIDKSNDKYRVGIPSTTISESTYVVQNSGVGPTNGSGAQLIKIDTNRFVLFFGYGSSFQFWTFDPTTLVLTQELNWSFGTTRIYSIVETSVANKFIFLHSNNTANLYYQVVDYSTPGQAPTLSTVTLLADSASGVAFFGASSWSPTPMRAIKAAATADKYVAMGRGGTGYHRIVHFTYDSVSDTCTTVYNNYLTNFTANTSSYGFALVSLSSGTEFHYVWVSTVNNTYEFASYGVNNDAINSAPLQIQGPLYSTSYWVNNPRLYKYNATTAILTGNPGQTNQYSGVFTITKTGNLNSLSNISNSNSYYWSGGQIICLGDNKLFVHQHDTTNQYFNSSLYYGGVYKNGSFTSIIGETTVPPQFGLHDRRLIDSNGVYKVAVQNNYRHINVYKNESLYRVYSFQTQYRIANVKITSDGFVIAAFVYSSGITNYASSTNSIFYYKIIDIENTASSSQSIDSVSMPSSYSVSLMSDFALDDSETNYYIFNPYSNGSTFYRYLSKFVLNKTNKTFDSGSTLSSPSGGSNSFLPRSSLVFVSSSSVVTQMYTNTWYRDINGVFQNNTPVYSSFNLEEFSQKTLLGREFGTSPLLKFSTTTTTTFANCDPYFHFTPKTNNTYLVQYQGSLSFRNEAGTTLTTTNSDRLLDSTTFEYNDTYYNIDYFGDLGIPVKISGYVEDSLGTQVYLFRDLNIKYKSTQSSYDQVLLKSGEKFVLTTDYRNAPLVRIETITA